MLVMTEWLIVIYHCRYFTGWTGSLMGCEQRHRDTEEHMKMPFVQIQRLAPALQQNLIHRLDSPDLPMNRSAELQLGAVWRAPNAPTWRSALQASGSWSQCALKMIWKLPMNLVAADVRRL